MEKLTVWLIVLVLFIAACNGPAGAPVPPVDSTQGQPAALASPTPTFVPTTAPAPTSTPEPALVQPTGPPPTATPIMEMVTPAAYDGQPLPEQEEKLFSASGACAVCHSQMVDESGTDVSIDTFWRSTMMANAARDPYWRASVQEEILSYPDYQAVIEDTCATCHMPMARFTAAAAGGQGQI